MFEPLEQRCLLAAGLIPLDLTVPINRTVEGFTVVGTAQVAADVVVLDPANPADISLTNAMASGTGTLNGTFLGANISGSFTVSGSTPTYEFDFDSPNILGVKVEASGTLNLLVDGTRQVTGTFTSTVEGELDSQTRRFTGMLRLQASADGFQRTIDVPIVVEDAISSFAVPNAALASLSDHVFHDTNENGVRDANEPGVGGVELVLLNGETDEVIESTVSDDAGFYSFINLPDGPYAIRVERVPDNFDLGKQDVGNNDAIDSDVNSRSGRSDNVALTGSQHIRTLDVALRQVTFEWQNPNTTEDVTGEGDVTALDALRIIEHLASNGGDVELAADRPIGSEFYDVTGDGFATALDALRVINAIADTQNSAPAPESVQLPAAMAIVGSRVVGEKTGDQDLKSSLF